MIILNCTSLQMEKQEHQAESYNFDGDPLNDQAETDDDAPMDGAALLKTAMKQNLHNRSPSPDTELDIDGKMIIFMQKFKNCQN